MVQSLERAFTILDAVATRPAPLGAIAERARLPKSTTSRLLGSLEQLGAVERADGGWRIGETVAALARGASPERMLVVAARPELTALVDELGEDAGLGIPDGYAIRYVDQVASGNPVQVRDWTGTRAPLHAVPSGLLLLAEWPAEALDAYVARGLERVTPHTIAGRAELDRRLADVREAGVAWGREEFAEGIASVAAAVRDGAGKAIAAVHVHGPAYRFPPQAERGRIAARVRGAAAAVTARLRDGS